MVNCIPRITLVSISVFLSVNVYANLLIQEVKIINKEGIVFPPSNVYIENGLITQIAQRIQPNAKDRVISGRGRFLIPGLIDSHVHLQGVPGESDALPDAIRSQAVQQIPRSYLYFGFTTVLDLMNNDEFIEQWNKQKLAPKAYHCAGVPIPGGYPLAWIPKHKQLSSPMATFYLFDPQQKELMSKTPGSELHKVKPLVKTIANTQARCIKAFYEKGFGPFQNLPVPTQAMIQDLVEEARKYELPVFIHGNSMAAHRFAVDSGASLLVHGVWHGAASTYSTEIADLARATGAKGIRVQPTIQVIYGEKELFNSMFFENMDVKKAMPATLIQWYQSEAGQWFTRRMAANYDFGKNIKDPYLQANKILSQPLKTVKAHTRALLAEQVTLAFGSDTPSGPMYTQFPGFNGRQEMAHWVELGVPLVTLFKSLTYSNAKLLGLENTIGSVEVGKRADLLLLKQNPLKNIAAYDSIEWVILAGKAVQREQLAAD